MTFGACVLLALVIVAIQGAVMGCIVLGARYALRAKTKAPAVTPCPIGGCRFPRGHLWPCWFGKVDPRRGERA